MPRLIALIALLFVTSNAIAQDAESPLDPLYERIATDLQNGNPLIVVANYGMWQVRADQPERNLNWGVGFGHATLMKRAAKDKHVAKNFAYKDWKLVLERSAETGPSRTLVFTQQVKPNAEWQADGVTKPFDVFLVMYAWESQTDAALAATRLLRQDVGELLVLDDGRRVDTGKAQVAGYFGHNFFYDYEGFQWSGLKNVEGQIEQPKGTFAVGCNTARVPGFDAWFEPNAYALLFSKSLMASEGYSTLALMDGLLRHLQGKALVDLADRTYQYFQKIPKPERRVGRPFVSQGYKLQ